MPIAFNPTTGEAVLWDGKAWVPTKTATNSETGENVAWDGFSWEKINVPKPPSGLLPALSSGTDILQKGLYSALEGGAKSLGFEDLARFAGEGAARNEEEANLALPNPQSFGEAQSVGDYFTAAKEALGTSLPSMGPAAAGALAGAGLGSIVPGLGTTVGALIGGTLGGIPGFYGSNREAQKDVNEGVVKSEGAAILAAVPQAAMDTVLALAFPGLGKAVGGGLLTRVVKKGAEGIIEEVPTEIGQQILERYQAGKPIADEEAINEYREVAIAAGVLGGGLGGVGGALQKRIQEPAPVPQTPADLAEHIANVRANMPGGGAAASPAGGPAGGPPGLPSPNAPAGLLPPPDAGSLGLTGPQPQPQLPPPSGLAGLLPPPAIRLPPPSEGLDGTGGPPPTPPTEPPSSGGAGEFFQPPTDDLIERLAQPETGANAPQVDTNQQAAQFAAQQQEEATRRIAENAQQQASGFDLPPQPQAAPEAAPEADQEPVDLASLSQQDYADYLAQNGLPPGVTAYNELTARPELRGLSGLEKNKFIADNMQKVRAYTDYINSWNLNNLKNIKYRPGEWEHFRINNDQNSSGGGRHKSYATFADPFSLTKEDFQSFLEKLRDNGYNGQVKIPSTASRFINSFDNLVMHGATEADALFARQTALEHFGDKISFTQMGRDSDTTSHTDMLSTKVEEALKAQKAQGGAKPAPKPFQPKTPPNTAQQPAAQPQAVIDPASLPIAQNMVPQLKDLPPQGAREIELGARQIAANEGASEVTPYHFGRAANDWADRITEESRQRDAARQKPAKVSQASPNQNQFDKFAGSKTAEIVVQGLGQLNLAPGSKIDLARLLRQVNNIRQRMDVPKDNIDILKRHLIDLSRSSNPPVTVKGGSRSPQFFVPEEKATPEQRAAPEQKAAPQKAPASERNAEIESDIAKTLLDMGLDGSVGKGGPKITDNPLQTASNVYAYLLAKGTANLPKGIRPSQWEEQMRELVDTPNRYHPVRENAASGYKVGDRVTLTKYPDKEAYVVTIAPQTGKNTNTIKVASDSGYPVFYSPNDISPYNGGQPQGGAKPTNKINVPLLLKNYNEKARHQLTLKEIRQSLAKMANDEDNPVVGEHGSGDGYAAKPGIRDFVEGANAPEAKAKSAPTQQAGERPTVVSIDRGKGKHADPFGLSEGTVVNLSDGTSVRVQRHPHYSREDKMASTSSWEMRFKLKDFGINNTSLGTAGNHINSVLDRIIDVVQDAKRFGKPPSSWLGVKVETSKKIKLPKGVSQVETYQEQGKDKRYLVTMDDGTIVEIDKLAADGQWTGELVQRQVDNGEDLRSPFMKLGDGDLEDVLPRLEAGIEAARLYSSTSLPDGYIVYGENFGPGIAQADKGPFTAENVVNNEKPEKGIPPQDTLIFMTCGQEKQEGGFFKAIELYTGSFFKTLRANLPKEGPRPKVIILSAEHGIISSNTRIEPYERRLDAGKIDELIGNDRRITESARRTAGAFNNVSDRGQDFSDIKNILLVGGADYQRVMKEIIARLKNEGTINADVGVMATKGDQGYQLGQLKDYIQTVTGQKAAPAEEAAAPKYKAPVKYDEVTVKIPTGGKINTQYEIVELDSLKQATGELQNRDRDDNVNYEAVLQGMYSKFDPTDLGADPNSDRGAPIVGDDDIIDSGNGRALLLGKVYNGKDDAAIERQDAYKGFLEEQGYNIEGFKRPVLIRRRLTELTPEGRRNLVVGSNKDKKVALKATEQARETASYMKKNGSIRKYFGGDLNLEKNAGFIQDFMQSVPMMDRGTYMTSDGELSTPGQTLIKAAIEALAYDDKALINTLLEQKEENDIKALGNVLEALAGRWAKLRQSIEDGDVRPELDVTKQFVDAVKALRDIRGKKNWNLKDYLAQEDFVTPKNPVTVAFLKMFHAPNTDKETGNYKAASQKSTMDSVDRFISIASEQKVNPGFFDDKVELSPLEIIQQINDERLNKNDQGNMFASVLGDTNASALNASLPKKLTGAKPRYGFGKKNFPLAFDSDFSKALYIAYRKQNPYREWLIDQGVADGAIDIMGKLQRDNIKQIARDMPSGETLRVEDDFSIKPPEKAPKASPKGKKGANAPKADFEEEIAPTAGKRQAEAAAAPQPVDPERLKQSRAVVKKFLQDMIDRGDNNAAQSALKAIKDKGLSDTEVHHYLLAMDITSRILGPTKIKPAYLFTNLALNHPQAGRAAAMAIPPGRSQKYMEGLMIFSLDPGSRKRIQMNAFHEAFHILQGLMQAHDPKTTQIINKAFKSGMTLDDVDPSIKRALQSAIDSDGVSYWDFFKSKYDANPVLRSEFKKDYEASAYMFGLLAAAKQNGQNLNALMPAFKRFLNFIEQFKQRMGNALRGLGYRSVEDVFNDYIAGRQQRGYELKGNTITSGGARASLLGPEPDEKELERRKDRAREISNGFWNKDAVQAAEWLANNTKPEYQPIARKVADRLKLMKRAGLKTTVTILERGDKPRIGSAVASVEVMFGRRMDATNSSSPQANVIYRGLTDDTRSKPAPPLSDEIALHELIHAAIHGSIALARRSPKDLAPNLHEAVKDLNDLRNFVVSRYNDRFRQAKAGKLTLLPIEEKFDKWNTLNDEDEFVAWGMTSPEFQKYLDDLPTPSGLKTRFDDFVNAIRKLLGFAPGQETSLSKLIQISADMLGVSIDELRAVGNARNARVVSENETYEERTDQPMASVLMGDAPVSPGTAEVEAVEKVKRGKAPVFKGTIKLLHGSENPDKKSFTKNYTGDRYEGGESEFGSDSVVYLDNTSKWTGGEYRGFSARNVYEVEANFKNAYVISPETLDDLFSILPDRTQEAERLRGIWKKYNDQPDGPNSKEPSEIDPAFESLQRKIISPEDIAKILRKMGHDGIIVQGFDQFAEDYQSRNRSGRTPIDRAVNRGIYETTFQDQVVSFSPEDIRVVRRIEDYQQNRKAYAKPVRAPVSMASVLMDDDSAHAPEIREGVATVMQGANTAARSAVSNWQKVKLVAKSVFDPLAKLPNTADYLVMRYRLVGRIDELEEEARGFHDTMKKATKEQSEAIFEYLTTRGAAVPNLPAELRDVAVTVKRRIKEIGIELSDPRVGILSPQSVAMYEDKYLPRLYMKYLLEEKGLVSTGPRMGLMEYARQRTDVDEETRVALGEVKDPGFASFAALYRPQRDIAVMNFLKGIAEASDKDWVYPNQLIEWKGTKVTAFWLADEANNIRERMLFEPDATKKATMARVADDMQRLAADNVGEVPPQNYKRLPKSNRYGALKGLAVREEIYNDLISMSGFDPDPNLVDKMFGDKNSALAKGTQFWKMSKTILNPPTQIRQIISNAVMLNLSGVPLHKVASRMLQAMDAIKNDTEVWKKAKEYGIKGAGFGENELREATNLLREYLAENSTGIMNPKKLMNIVAKITGKAGDFYQYTDQVFKLAKIIDEVERKGIARMPNGAAKERAYAEAALQGHKWFFDYSLVHRGIKSLRTMPFGAPFITYYYKALPLIVEVATNPRTAMRFAPYIALMAAMPAMVASMYDVDDEDVDKLKMSLSEKLREKPNMLIFPFKDQNGNWQFLDWGYFFPWAMFVDTGRALVKGDVVGALGTVGALTSPALSVASAIKTNVDPFTGRQIINEYDPPKEKMMAFLSYVNSLIMPPIVTSYGAFGKAIEAATNSGVNRYGEPNMDAIQITARAMGFNFYPVVPELQRVRNIKRMDYEIQMVKSNMTQSLKDKSLTPEKREAIRKDFLAELARRREARNKYIQDSAIPAELSSRANR